MQFLFLIIICFLLCLPAWYTARKRQTWFDWDYATVFAPMPIWLIYSIIQIGSNGLSNLIEILIIAAFLPLALSLRVFLMDRFWKNAKRNSLWIFFLCCIVLPLILRIGMPVLSE